MWLCFVDESGNTGNKLDDPDQPLHVISAVMVPESQLDPLRAAFDAVAEAHGPEGWTEFHGADLYSGSDCWLGVKPQARIDAYAAALAVMDTVEVHIAHASINKARLGAKYAWPESPHVLAMTYLAQKFDDYIGGWKELDRQRALIVADQTQEHEAFVIERVDAMRRLGDPFWGKRLKRVAESVYFVESQNSPGVQLADLIAYALNRRFRIRKVGHPRGRGDAALEELYEDLIAPHIRTWRECWP